jgi:transposase-like protein
MNHVRRERRSASEWPALLEQWSSSGETAERFAARIGVKPATLERWRKAMGSKPRPGGAAGGAKKRVPAESVFAQVVEPAVHAERAAGLIEVVMRDGLIVRLHGSVDAETLGAVLGCMSRC